MEGQWQSIASPVFINTGSNDDTTYDELADFVAHRMRLSHIYQPLLIRTLLDSGGVATVRQIAQAFLGQASTALLRCLPSQLMVEDPTIGFNRHRLAIDCQ